MSRNTNSRNFGRFGTCRGDVSSSNVGLSEDSMSSPLFNRMVDLEDTPYQRSKFHSSAILSARKNRDKSAKNSKPQPTKIGRDQICSGCPGMQAAENAAETKTRSKCSTVRGGAKGRCRVDRPLRPGEKLSPLAVKCRNVGSSPCMKPRCDPFLLGAANRFVHLNQAECTPMKERFIVDSRTSFGKDSKSRYSKQSKDLLDQCCEELNKLKKQIEKLKHESKDDRKSNDNANDMLEKCCEEMEQLRKQLESLKKGKSGKGDKVKSDAKDLLEQCQKQQEQLKKQMSEHKKSKSTASSNKDPCDDSKGKGSKGKKEDKKPSKSDPCKKDSDSSSGDCRKIKEKKEKAEKCIQYLEKQNEKLKKAMDEMKRKMGSDSSNKSAKLCEELEKQAQKLEENKKLLMKEHEKLKKECETMKKEMKKGDRGKSKTEGKKQSKNGDKKKCSPKSVCDKKSGKKAGKPEDDVPDEVKKAMADCVKQCAKKVKKTHMKKEFNKEKKKLKDKMKAKEAAMNTSEEDDGGVLAKFLHGICCQLQELAKKTKKKKKCSPESGKKRS